MNKTLKWIVVNACRLLVSATFVFSGIVKLIDPHGTGYKLADYAAALSLTHLSEEPVPLVLAIALALTEFCLGIYLLFGIRRRMTTRLIVAILLVFTPLTLITGWYGMNFVHMPELAWKGSYPVVIAVSVLIVIGCLWFFKKKKWL